MNRPHPSSLYPPLPTVMNKKMKKNRRLGGGFILSIPSLAWCSRFHPTTVSAPVLFPHGAAVEAEWSSPSGRSRTEVEQPTSSGAFRAGAAPFLLPHTLHCPNPGAAEVDAQLEIQGAASSGRRSRRARRRRSRRASSAGTARHRQPPIYRPSPPPPRIASAAGRHQHRHSPSSPPTPPSSARGQEHRSQRNPDLSKAEHRRGNNVWG